MGDDIETYCNRTGALGCGLPGVLISIRVRLALRFARAGKAAIERPGRTV
jgi:hypothetical protein